MRRSPLVAAVLALAVLAAPRGAHAQEAADVAAARDLFREGAALAQQNRWEEARDRYERSLTLKRAAMSLYSLGVAQHRTGRLVGALESYRAFLAEPQTAKTEPWEQPARDAITELEKRVGHLSTSITPATLAELVVKIDGREVPGAALGTKRLVDPGAHQVTAVALGYRQAQAAVTVGEGEQAAVSLTLEPAPTPAFTPATAPPATAPPTADGALARPSPALPIALMAVGGGVFVAGVTVGLIGVEAAADAPTRDGPQASAARTKTLAGDILGGAGVVAAGTGLVLLLIRRAPEKPPAAARAGQIEPWIRGSTAGVGVRF